ncbi:hypothetical protein [Acetobacter conturbans]|uniref:Uncharacterized protein n=1 Tax=Acetobacter conturbans TaxID=1737472 RepID=A0ABX0K2S8_9PROT|nr:hypothetical protein [Acetobacter conturbans]NHN90061.1 hypothetical protein [Acetobacter conturbans]
MAADPENPYGSRYKKKVVTLSLRSGDKADIAKAWSDRKISKSIQPGNMHFNLKKLGLPSFPKTNLSRKEKL